MGVAEAHNDYPWTKCSFEFTDVGADVFVKKDTVNPFPVNGTGDGVTNSFTDRIGYGISQWNSKMAYGGMISYTGLSDDVRLRYGTTTTQDFGVTTWFLDRSGTGASCSVHGGSVQQLQYVIVDIRSRSDWFTQDNTRRAYWEGCPAGTSYTCSKWFDFGSTITHELGHTLGLMHPQEVDIHNGESASNGTQALHAHCNSTTIYDGSDDSTICPAGGAASTSETRYESSRRTLSAYDVAALARHEAVN